jgi:hypothetical protein
MIFSRIRIKKQLIKKTKRKMKSVNKLIQIKIVINKIPLRDKLYNL